MTNWKSTNRPTIPTPPGEILRRELKARGIKQSEFASRVGLRSSHLSEVLNGNRAINDQLSLILEDELGIKAEFWLRLQAIYTRCKKEMETLEVEEVLSLNELRSYDDVIDVNTILKSLNVSDYCTKEKLNFFSKDLGLVCAAEYAVKTRGTGLWRKSSKVGLDSRMINTWAVLAHYAVKNINPTGVFDLSNIDSLIQELIKIFNTNHNTIKNLSETFDAYGIKFAVVEKVNKASVDGYSFRDNGIPAIVVTCRLPKIDNLAFSVLHELAHHILHIKDDNASFISCDGDDNDKIEIEADEFAAEALIPKTIWKTLPPMNCQNIYVFQRECCRWAEEKGYNKWIVLGRISHEFGMYKIKSDNSRNIN